MGSDNAFVLGLDLQTPTGPSRYLQLISKKAKALENKSTRRLGRQKQTGCNFCKNNGEPTKVYQSHVLKDSNEKVICPVLYAYTCPICNATGEDSHTVSHCPNHPERMEHQRWLNEQWQQLMNPVHQSNMFEKSLDEPELLDELKPLGAYITNKNVFTNNILGILLTKIEIEEVASKSAIILL
ncbi:uncharacterized protein LOC131885186 isoform X2 [Tigriopus californicus]|uniref:uncharacterized protein LOC131885186 isoform X2 n=1 Tax=Tigriopus californicus TaxID=6832 RepID=UPI0027DA4553|nr:uncharacterized protein LOC131885186 isoform X2 [Tigriopus californicus]